VPDDDDFDVPDLEEEQDEAAEWEELARELPSPLRQKILIFSATVKWISSMTGALTSASTVISCLLPGTFGSSDGLRLPVQLRAAISTAERELAKPTIATVERRLPDLAHIDMSLLRALTGRTADDLIAKLCHVGLLSNKVWESYHRISHKHARTTSLSPCISRKKLHHNVIMSYRKRSVTSAGDSFGHDGIIMMWG